jgi:hypothetical protein
MQSSLRGRQLLATVPGETRNYGLPSALWRDPDVRWLTGVHEAGGRDYLVKEPFEELIWWLQLPSLLRLASKSEPNRSRSQRPSPKLLKRP